MKTLLLSGIVLVALGQRWGAGAQQPTWGVPRTPTQGQSMETALCTPPPGDICSASSQPPYVLISRSFFTFASSYSYAHAQQKQNLSPSLLPHVARHSASQRLPGRYRHLPPLLSPIFLVCTTFIHFSRFCHLHRSADHGAI
jgi:hypothetical protein